MTDVAERLEELRDRGLYRRLRLVERPAGPAGAARRRARCCCSARTTTSASPTTRGCARRRPRRRCAGAPAPGASRLISGNMEPHRRAGGAAGRVQGLRGGAAVRLRLPGQHRHDRGPGRRAARSSSPTSSTTPASSTAAGSPGPRPSSTATATSSTSPGACARRGGRGGADRHRRRLLDGRRRRAAARSWSSWPAAHGCRLMVDEAHATGALGPGGRGSVAAAGLSGEVDVVVGTLGKALGSYGAYVCASAEIDRLPGQHRPPLHLLHRAAAARSVAAALAALELLESQPERVERLQAQRARRCATALAAEGLDVGRLARPRSCRSRSATPSRRWSSASALLERGVFAQGIRPPTVPEGSSRLRFTVMATHRARRAASAPRKLVGARRPRARPARRARAERRRVAGSAA